MSSPEGPTPDQSLSLPMPGLSPEHRAIMRGLGEEVARSLGINLSPEPNLNPKPLSESYHEARMKLTESPFAGPSRMAMPGEIDSSY